ncbi:MAG: hypothetical protein WKF92_05210 [Pyrinomonadaceae bacterium]
MKIFKLPATILAVSLFLIACNSEQTQQSAAVEPYPNDPALAQNAPDQNDYWAKDNLDLQRVGNLLERSNSPEEFEAYLNEDDGINNLDLNGDGYVDYLSVDEYQDRGPNQRGLSIFSRFGPDIIQEIANVIFYRDNQNSPGARILLSGNEQIYGDNNYYETNWADRSIGLVTTLFGSRDQYYRSPYYYDNYPDGYNLYQVVETPVYRSRVEQLYAAPVFVYTTAPTFISQVKIKSPHNGQWMDKVHAKLAKPTKEQAEFKKNNPNKPERAKDDKADKPGKSEDAPGREKQSKEVRKAESEKGNPGKPDKSEKQNDKPGKPDKGGNDKGKGKP